jgi:glycosyltransferase involved in cell wall biosynthesis
VIPLGVDPAVFAPDPARPPPTPGGPVVVGYAGRLAAHKGVDVLLDAAAAQPRLTLRLAGAGPDEARLRERVTELGLAERVSFVGALDTDALADFYRGLDVLAVPSLTTDQAGWSSSGGSRSRRWRAAYPSWRVTAAPCLMLSAGPVGWSLRGTRRRWAAPW